VAITPIKRFLSALRPYFLSLVVLALATALIALTYARVHAVAPGFAGYGVVFLVALLFAAWTGYGPGIVAVIMVTFFVPFLFFPRYNLARVDYGRFLLLLLVSILVSRISASRTRIESLLRKHNEELEERVQQRTLELERMIADLEDAKRSLEEANISLEEKASIIQHSNDAILGKTLDGVISSWNPAAERLYGYSAEEIVGQHISSLAPPDRKEEMEALLQRIREGQSIEPFETVRVRKDGELINVHLTISPIVHTDHDIRGASIIARDITEQKRSEQQLREMQKLESLGLIAGGVAHDFNNLLVGILGNASLVLETLPASSPNYVPLSHVVQASEKAAHLTQQMLAYAGKGRFVTTKIDLSTLVEEISSLIQTSIPKNVQLRLELSRGLPAIDADPGQIQQLIMNLVINGAEAIGETLNGTVFVTTDIQDVDDAYLRQNFAGELLRLGTYVSLEVQDTGCGMTEETKGRIFDPFFTTKFTGRGLGLAAVLGIVRGHQGTIRIYSVPGKGSTFKILLPAVTGGAQSSKSVEIHRELRGSGTILVVDDEEVVRATAKTALERYGYLVLAAADGKTGVDLFREHDEIILVLLDMMMPTMSGEEAFRKMLMIRPTSRIVISSGYNEVEAIRRFTTKGIAGFIQKPYTAAQLARTIKRVLESPIGVGSGA
jgi:PAS domain S-box-containing protein